MEPGIFGRDFDTGSPEDQHRGKPFFYLDANRTGAGDDDADNTVLRHIDTKAPADLNNITGHRYTGVSGWKHFFTAKAPNTQGYSNLNNNGDRGTCLQIYDQHVESISCGLYIGSITGHESMLAHWTHSVIGIQFQWTSKNTTKKSNGGFQLHDLWLCYMDTEYGIIQYAPVCKGSNWQGEVEIIGDDPAEKAWSGTEPGTPLDKVDGSSTANARAVPETKGAIDNAEEANGRVIAYVSGSHAEKIRKNKMMLVGVYMSTLPGYNSGANYDRFWDIFCVKFLVHKIGEKTTSSVKMLGEPVHLNEAMTARDMMITSRPTI